MAIRKTTKEFVEEANKIHRENYDYSLVEYFNSRIKITIICKKHGQFQQQPRAHLAGQGCSRCNQSENWKPSKSLEDFINQANLIHHHIYDYSKSIYEGTSKKLQIICKTHGEFNQQAHSHLLGRGCPKCANNQLKSLSQFISDAIQLHNNKYDYSNSEYKSAKTKLTIICRTHGEFKQTPNQHLLGQGCPKCGRESMKKKHNLGQEGFLKKAGEIHEETYDYSKVIYLGRHQPIIIICQTHGEFSQRPSDHINGRHRCPKCAGNHQLTTTEFIERAQARWNNRYSYESSIYTNSKTKISVTCQKHGEFEITAGYHLADGGCPSCALSTEQYDLSQFIRSIYNKQINSNDRTAIYPYELDVYLLEHKLAIELNGNYYHSYYQKETIEQRLRHCRKHELCVASAIKLLQFTDHEWHTKKDLVQSMIRHQLGLSNRIYARKCDLTIEVPNKFFHDNHISGYKPADITIGLSFNNDIVCSMSLSKHKKYQWEVCRLATKQGLVVVGGADKLLKWFIQEAKPSTIFTYADRRFSVGGVYRQLGFTEIGITKPNYMYLDSNMKPHSRLKFQKHKLSTILKNFDQTKTEAENMFSNDYRRLWDAGHYKFLLSLIF